MIKQRINKLHKKYLKYNLSRFLQKKIKLLLKNNKLKTLSKQEDSEIRVYFSKYGFKKINITITWKEKGTINSTYINHIKKE